MKNRKKKGSGGGGDKVVTQTYLDKQLAKLSEDFTNKLLQQSKELTEQFDKKLLEQSEHFDKKLLEQSEHFDKKLLEQSEKFDKKFFALSKQFTTQIGVLGNRWGKDAERAFYKAMKEKIEKEFHGKVEKWTYKQKLPEIHPERDKYEVDVVTTNGKINLIEIKMSVHEPEVYNFADNIKAYELVNKKKSDRRILVTPFAIPDAIKLAYKSGIEIIFPEPFDYP